MRGAVSCVPGCVKEQGCWNDLENMTPVLQEPLVVGYREEWCLQFPNGGARGDWVTTLQSCKLYSCITGTKQVVCLISIVNLSLLSLTVPQPRWACPLVSFTWDAFLYPLTCSFPAANPLFISWGPTHMLASLKPSTYLFPKLSFWRWYCKTVCLVFHALSTEYQRKINSLPHEL